MTKTAVATDPDDLLEAFKGMTLIELHDFIRRFKTTFGVEDVAPVPPGNPAPPAPAAEPEEQDEFCVTLTAIGSGKIQVIKVIREILKLGLADSKAFVEGVPKVVLPAASKADAEAAAERLRAAGATVSVT